MEHCKHYERIMDQCSVMVEHGDRTVEPVTEQQSTRRTVTRQQSVVVSVWHTGKVTVCWEQTVQHTEGSLQRSDGQWTVVTVKQATVVGRWSL